LGPVVYGSDPTETFLGRDFSQGRGYSETVASEIDSEMRQLIDDAYDQCATILNEHMDQLERVAAALLERETISGKEFKTLMEGGTLPPLVLDPEKTDAKAAPKPATEPAEPPVQAAAPVPPVQEPPQQETPPHTDMQA